MTDAPPRRTLLTLRVSTDSGRTWSPVREIRAGDRGPEPRPLLTMAWPPCRCPSCR